MNAIGACSPHCIEHTTNFLSLSTAAWETAQLSSQSKQYSILNEQPSHENLASTNRFMDSLSFTADGTFSSNSSAAWQTTDHPTPVFDRHSSENGFC
jgi:hypothetical protein